MPDNSRSESPPGLPLLTLTERMRDCSERNVPPEPEIIFEDVVVAVLDTMGGRLSPTEATLLKEIAGLGRIIDQAKAEIAEVNVDSIRASHIPTATCELDAIVQHTALATNSILESCEALDSLSSSLESGPASVVQTAVTHIYEACSFQDITGQRITKVVKALQAIEAKVAKLASGVAISVDPATSAASPEETGPHGGLLNGPTMPHEAMAQDDIDKLLGDF